jgi:CheY-like chemotaxis protein
MGARSMRVLVVDDHLDTVESTAMLLRLDGHQVETATDGVRGTERAAAFRPELVLLDLGMPDVDGFAVARQIQNLSLPVVPYLVAVTGHTQETDKRRCAESGFDLHLAKPLEAGILRDLTLLLEEAWQLRDESLRLRNETRSLLAQRSTTLDELVLQQIEMGHLCLDAAKNTSSAEMKRRRLDQAGRAYERAETWIEALAYFGSDPAGVYVKLCALGGRLFGSEVPQGDPFGRIAHRSRSVALPPEVALARLKRQVAHRAHARGIEVKVQLEPAEPLFVSGPERISVKLSTGAHDIIVTVDQDAFAEADSFFEAFVLPQLQDAIDDLAR